MGYLLAVFMIVVFYFLNVLARDGGKAVLRIEQIEQRLDRIEAAVEETNVADKNNPLELPQ